MRKTSLLLVTAVFLLLTGCNSADDSISQPDSSGSNDAASPITEDPTQESPPETPTPRESNIDPQLSAHEFVSNMGVGWNLGNTFDAVSAPGSRLTGDIAAIETLWVGGVGFQTTQTLIQTVKNAGFESLRIPVSWAKVADPDDNWKIREDWMERVKQVVDWALEEDMIVIINSHHDNEAMKLGIDGADKDDHPGRQFAVSIWTQIAEEFIDYDERLVFETQNEPRHEGGKDEWWGGTQEVRDNVNYINQAVVDAIRATGGSNQHRFIMVPTHAAGISPNALGDMVIPEDPGNDVNKIILSIHTYSPFNWAHDGKGEYKGPDSFTGDLDNVKQTADRLGVPVVLGEWGTNHASMGSNPDQELRNEQRPVHAEDYVREALARGMVPLWWDNGGFNGTEHTWGIIRRIAPHEISDLHQQVIDGIMRGAGKID